MSRSKRLLIGVIVALGIFVPSAQATYTQQATLATDATFQQQIQVAMLQAAANIMTEAVTTQGHVARAQFATQVLQNPTHWQPIIAMLIAAQGNNPMTPLTVPSTVADTLVQTAVNAQWSNLAGYFAQ